MIKLVIEKYPNLLYKEAKGQIQYQNIDSCNNGDFEMSLYSDKKEYRTIDKIKIWTTLKYIGNNDKVTIWHAGSVNSDTYFNYLITDGKFFNVQSASHMIQKSTILVKDRLYHFNYQKSGDYNEDDPDAKFWEKFYSEKDLLLPKGEYTITSTGAFRLFSDLRDYVILACELKIKVE